LTGIAFGLVPSLQATNPNIATTLKDLAGNVMGGAAQAGFRKALVAAQVALSLLLLIGAGLFVRSLSNLRTLDPGFRTQNLIQFSVNPRSIAYDVPRTRAFYPRLEERLHALPGVRAAGVANMPVLTGNEWDTGTTIVGVVNDTRYEGLRDEIPPQVFLCTTQNNDSGMVVYVRTDRDPDGAFGAVRAAVREIDPNLPLVGLKTLERQLDESLVTERMI